MGGLHWEQLGETRRQGERSGHWKIGTANICTPAFHPLWCSREYQISASMLCSIQRKRMLNLLYLELYGSNFNLIPFPVKVFLFQVTDVEIDIHAKKSWHFFWSTQCTSKVYKILLGKISQQEVLDHGLCNLNYSEHRGQNREQSNIREATIHNARKTIVKWQLCDTI